MLSRSSKQLAVVLCAATLVALAEGIVTGEKSRRVPWQPRVEPTFDLSSVVGVPSCANALNELGSVVGFGMNSGFCEGSPGPRTAGWSISTRIPARSQSTITARSPVRAMSPGAGLVPASGRATA